MNLTHTLGAAALAALFIFAPDQAAAQDRHDPRPGEPPRDRPIDLPADRLTDEAHLHAAHVDVALLLDTSNSMDGLINQAKSQLWTIVRQFADARHRGHAPRLRVALFEYGNTSLPASEGYIRQVVPLTDDLDKISQALFALTTNGGDEYCGQVIDEAIKRLDWAEGDDDKGKDGVYKAIFIAGNEPFTQGEVDYRVACGKAVGREIVVNTIHCGSHAEGVRGQWQNGAEIGGGKFFNIDQDRRRPHIPCPQDPRLAELNEKLNTTYLWYGQAEVRSNYARNQRAQDRNAEEMSPSSAAERASVKAGSAYSNTGRDLIDTYRQDPEVLDKVAEAELPEEMQSLEGEERAAYLKEKADERAALQEEIRKLSAEREAYYQQELAKLEGEEDTLGAAVNAAVRDQLSEAGFEIAPTTQPAE